MAEKYLKRGTGSADLQEVEGQASSAGVGDAGKLVALNPSGKLDGTLFPTGVGEEIITLEASEALSAGDFVNVWDDAGTPKMRKADATATGKAADGFVVAPVSAAVAGTFYAMGALNDQLSGLTPGAIYYLATTAGTATVTRPTATGNIIQRVGRAVNATTIDTGDYPVIEVL